MGNDNQIGTLILTAVALIVGVILLTAAAQLIGETTQTTMLTNQSIGVAVTNLTPQYVTNCRAITSVLIFNATGDVRVPVGNYTVENNQVYNGNLAVKITPIAATVGGYNRGIWTIDAVCQPTTYSDDSGARAVAGVIIIMFAIALAIVALYPTMKERFN